MLDVIAEGVLQDGVRFVGWAALKLVTFGRYRSVGSGAFLFEGGLGLALIGATCVGLYVWA